MKIFFKNYGLCFLLLMFCSFNISREDRFTKTVEVVKIQMKGMLSDIASLKGLPRSVNPDGSLHMINKYDWCSGFFPGNLWLTYEATGDKNWEKAAVRFTDSLKSLENYTESHDIGFMTYCSYGNAYRLTGKEQYKDVLVQSAKSLITRYNPVVKSIKSWDDAKSWRDQSTFGFPVIIDNMMNLELLFFASRVTGDPGFKNVAINHATTTMKNQLRPDYSCYHVINYDPNTGNVKTRETNQGFSDNSAWSRGQAWGIYGFTMVYRETKDQQFLVTAQKMADYFINHKNLPKDKVPYWDFDVDRPGFKSNWKYNSTEFKTPPRDASAAAVICSALFELSKYSGAKGKIYEATAVQMLQALTSEAYLAKPGTNHHFLLKHSVGNYPRHSEIDVPLVYADYYFLEALLRYKKMSASR